MRNIKPRLSAAAQATQVKTTQSEMDSNHTDMGAMANLEAGVDRLHLQKDENGASELKDWIEKRKRMEILLTGRTGTGKSTLVNALVGKRVAETGSNLSIGTKHVSGYEVKSREGMEIVVWDSPGLQDGSGEEHNYLREMKENCSDVDIIIYCIDVSVARAQLGGAEKEQMNDFCAIKKLTETFGPHFWKHSIFVLTRANALETVLKVKDNAEKKFSDRLKDWEKRIHAVLSEEGVPKEVSNKIPVKPAGHPKKPHLLGHKYWLSALWFSFTKHAKDPSQPVFTKMNQHRLKKEKDVTADDFKKDGHAQPIIVEPSREGYLASLLALVGHK